MARTFEELEGGDLLPLVDALPELMTPASAALGVPSLTEPGEGVGQQINNQRWFCAGRARISATR